MNTLPKSDLTPTLSGKDASILALISQARTSLLRAENVSELEHLLAALNNNEYALDVANGILGKPTNSSNAQATANSINQWADQLSPSKYDKKYRGK